ncbi:MAG: neutral zinc metallopeptidase [Candidatus Amulumruptor caecigallinarius]|nr:neutral zinc metallopeptidase [Candidatus Amulumruptor caecigallinarius]
MRLDGRRRSGNIEDRRGVSGKAIGFGGGIIGAIVIGIVTLLSGGDMGDVITNVVGSGSGTTTGTQYVETEEDRQLAEFASVILAGTEDVWTRIFREQGWGEYEPPKMVLFHGAVRSGCGHATARVGPFYCSADKTVYLDLDFLKDMQTNIGGSGDFAYAYVIAHEVGHHVQNLLGTLPEAHEQMSKLSETEANRVSVKIELQADYYAGVWGCTDNKMFNSLEPGDIEEAVDVASKIGDDYLQKKAYGREMPESFNHGRSEWRVRWLTKGLTECNPTTSSPFNVPYSSLGY